MEQQLDATHLRPGPFERAAAVGFCAMAIGAGTLLAAWGISFLWRYTPPEIRVVQEKPFTLEQPAPLKIERGELTIKPEQVPPAFTTGAGGDVKTDTGDVIRREVTVFSHVKHGSGSVVTGWNYSDGSGRVPVRQYCYYSAPNVDHSSRRVDIAFDEVRSPSVDAALVPDLEGALAKCHWWKA